MGQLLRSDFFKMLKSKMTIVMLILAIAMPALIVLMYVGINGLAGALGDESEAIKSLISIKTMVGSSYSLSNNMGMVIPIFSGLLVGFDMNNGTLRNKVISGHKREQIYASHLIVSAIFNIIAISLFTLATFLFSLIFFKYGVPFTKAEAINVLYYIITGTLGFIFVACFTTLIATTTKSNALIVVITIVFSLLSGIVLSIITMIDYSKIKYIIYLIPMFVNNEYMLGTITHMMFILGSVSLVVVSALLTVLGMHLFKKKDLK